MSLALAVLFNKKNETGGGCPPQSSGQPGPIPYPYQSMPAIIGVWGVGFRVSGMALSRALKHENATVACYSI